MTKMLYSLIVSVFLASLQAAIVRTQGGDVCGMTPPTLEQDFLESCSEVGVDAATCDRAWSAFMTGFAGIAPENVVASNYAPYFDVLPIEVMADQSLFWTRTMSLVAVVSMMNAMGVDVVSSFNTDSARILNNLGQLSWCGTENGGIDYDNNCTCSVTSEFWNQFSTEFALAASGNVFFLTDGEDAGGAFRESSFFARAELPNLRDDSVTRVVTLVIHREGKGESCSGTESSIQTLKNLIGNRPFSFDCYDIYGQANNTGQTQTIANCIRNVIDAVQQGTEGNGREIQCAGASPLQVSLMLLLLSLLIHCSY